MNLTSGLTAKQTAYSRMTQLINRFAKSFGPTAKLFLAITLFTSVGLTAETLSLNNSGDFTDEFSQRAGTGDNRFEEADAIGVAGSRAIRRTATGVDKVAYTGNTSLGSMLNQATVSIRFNYSTNSTGSGGVPLFVGVSSNPNFDSSETGTSIDDYVGVELSQRLAGSNESKLTLLNGVNGSKAQSVDSGFENLTSGWYEIEISMERVSGLLDLSVSLHRMSADGSTRNEEDVITGAISSLTNTDLLSAVQTYIYLGGSDSLNRGVTALDEISFAGFGTPLDLVAPTALIAQAISQSRIDLAWDDNSSNEAGFKIERRPINGSWAELANVSANTTSYSDTTVSSNSNYAYQVSATSSGSTSSPSNEAQSSTAGATVPIIPTNLVASAASATQVDLTWSDTSSNETYFRIERKTGSGSFDLLTDLTGNSVSYSDTNLTSGLTYTYRIRSANGAGLSVASNEASVFIDGDAGIPPPSNLIAQANSSSEVSLSWNDNTDLETGYRIKRKSGSGSYVTIVNVGNNVTSFTDSTVMPLNTYTYCVAGIRFNQFSSYSNESTVNTPALEPPLSPSSLSIGGQGLDYIIIGWIDRSNDESGFRVERKSDGGEFTLLADLDPESTFYTDNQVTELGSYTYRVLTYNDAGNSTPSNEASTQIEFKHPTQLGITAVSVDQVGLSWEDNSTAETAYIVERKTGQGGFEQLDLLAANSNSYIDTNVLPLSTYTYRVIATDGGGLSDPTNEVSANTPNLPVPGSPSGLVASLIDSSHVALTWTDNSIDETGFRVERMVGEGGWSELFQTSANTTLFQDAEVGELETFSYRVVAFNEGGDSSPSNEAAVFFPFNPPSNLVAQSSSSSRIDLTWDDNSLVGAGYRIERKSGEGEFEVLFTTEAEVFAYVDEGVTVDTTYTYRIVGVYEGGESGPTNEASATSTSDTTKPDSPAGLAATAIDFDQIHLTWVDNSDNESVFRIERKVGAEGEFAFVGNAPTDATSFTDKRLQPDTEHFYRITSYINGAQSSDLSNEASATTLSIPLPEASTGLVVASQTLSQVSLSWTDESEVEDGFKLQRKVGNGEFEDLVTVNQNVTYFNDDTVEERSSYTYRVFAFNLGGETATSNEAIADIPFAPPQLLEGSATAFSQIELNWVDSSSIETAYRVERRTGDEDWGSIGNLGENSVIFVDSSPDADTTYSYRVIAIWNGLESEPSNIVNVTTPNVPLPNGPTNLTITSLSPTSISVSWQDNSENELGFKIFRKELDGGVWVQLDQVSPDITLYVDYTAVAGVNYAYSVAAFNDAGSDDPVESEFRNPIVGRLINISTRGLVETDDNVMIGSFIIRGDGPKTVLIRGIGASLEGTINAPVLSDPQLTLVSGADLNNPIAYNDDWRDTDEAGIIAAGLPPTADTESALVVRLDPGPYSAILSGVNYSTGFGLVEVYEVDYSKNIRIINISTRSFVQPDDKRMIGGFIIRGDTPARVFIRVSGPSLSSTIENRLQDPTLELYTGQDLIDSNDNWKDSPQIGDIILSGIPPKDDREPAIVATLEPGSYTAVVGGAENSSGYGLLEIYDYPE